MAQLNRIVCCFCNFPLLLATIYWYIHSLIHFGNILLNSFITILLSLLLLLLLVPPFGQTHNSKSITPADLHSGNDTTFGFCIDVSSSKRWNCLYRLFFHPHDFTHKTLANIGWNLFKNMIWLFFLNHFLLPYIYSSSLKILSVWLH